MNINEFIKKKYSGENYIIQQKAYVLFWVNIIVSVILLLVTIVNLTTPASTHPVVISSTNIFLLVSLLITCWLLVKGRYNMAVTCTILALTMRIVAGCFIKLESMAQLGSNNNIYFMFSLLAFTSFFGKRSIITFVSLFLIAANISFVFIIKELYATTQMNYIVGSTINSTITLVIVFILSYFISRIADTALLKTQNELENNKKLSATLKTKVLELQSMNEEMEAMNEELVDTSRALMASNAEARIFMEMADASTQGFIISDAGGNITYANEAMKILINNDAAEHSNGKTAGHLLSRRISPGSWPARSCPS